MKQSIATLAKNIINKENPNINTEWLEFVSQDFENGELSAEQCYQSTKAFIRGLMAVGAVGVEVLDDIDNAYAENV